MMFIYNCALLPLRRLAVATLLLSSASFAAEFPVNLMIGTGGGLSSPGFTFPGATVPFGMVRLSPDATFAGLDSFLNKLNIATAGYSWRHQRVTGFSHTRLSGTGAAEGGLFRVTPLTDAKQFAKWKPNLKLDHGQELAEPGYYSIRFAKQKLQAEVTSTDRCGVHRYQRLDQKRSLHLLLDATSGLFKNQAGEDSRFAMDPETKTFSGSTHLNGQFSGRYGGIKAYYYGTWSRPATIRYWEANNWVNESTSEVAGSDIGAGMEFGPDVDNVELKFCMSYVSDSNARENFAAEVQGRSFDEVRANSATRWNAMFARARVESADLDIRTMFYTSLYHSFMMPTTFTDVNGEYLAFDKSAGRAQGYTYRTDMSLWDTFRTTHPLYSLIAPEIQRDSAISLLEMGRINGVLPRWPQGAGESGSMFGSPANFVLTETWLKGIRDIDVNLALKLMVSGAKETAPNGLPGRDTVCGEYGYCPNDMTHESVSKTLEYAWADSAIANLAGVLGDNELEAEFRKRSHAYKDVWDEGTGFFRPRHSNGDFMKFSPKLTPYLKILGKGTEAYAEGSAWHWRFSVPHEPREMVELYGGEENFVDRLSFFMEHTTANRNALYAGPYYWHGNQHDIHVIYLFNEAGRPDLTQYWARWALRERYANSHDGLDGNDDAGTLSAWYAFSAMGLYPQAGTDRYWVGSPAVDKATLNLGSGRELKIVANNQSVENVYVQKVSLNGSPLCRPWVTHQELANGSLEFTLGPTAASGGGFSCN